MCHCKGHDFPRSRVLNRVHVFLGQKPLKKVKIGDDQSKLLIATISSKKSNFKILIYTAVLILKSILLGEKGKVERSLLC